MINTNKIKGRLKELGLTQAEIATKLNMAQATINQKLNNARPMDLNEAEKLSEILGITPEEFGVYFFSNGVA